MERLRNLLIIAAVIFVAAASIFASAGPYIQAQANVTERTAPRSLHDQVMESRRTAPTAEDGPSRGSVLMFGLLIPLIAAAGVAGFYLYASGKTALLKEIRLGKKADSRQRRQQAQEAQPAASPAFVQHIGQPGRPTEAIGLPTRQPVRQLPPPETPHGGQ